MKITLLELAVDSPPAGPSLKLQAVLQTELIRTGELPVMEYSEHLPTPVSLQLAAVCA